MTIREFMKNNFKHFNAASVVDAAEGWVTHLEKGNKMLLTMAGAMSTAELGISLAEMIRAGKIHGICCTGANLEEDIFNLVAHKHYRRIPNYRSLTLAEEEQLHKEGMNRVTDTCIPEDVAVRRLEKHILAHWQAADKSGARFFPYEFMYGMLRSKELEKYYEIDPRNSWMMAACEKNIPVFTPGWEDSTLGNIFVAHCIKGDVKNISIMKSGLELMHSFVDWYKESTQSSNLGFFQIGGGIAGDFPICVVPLIRQDLEEDCKLWSYFAQISDSTTSYGSYSGATPSEKITWGKLSKDTPMYVIESDASIVAPLVFSYVLEK